MIYKHEDFIDKLAKIHPEIEEASLELITRRGLQGINRVMRSGQELIISNFRRNGKQDDWIKFFIYMTPEAQQKHAMKNFYRKERKKELIKQKEETDVNTTVNK